MEFVSSDTNVWLDFAIINKLEIPFKLPYTYIMNEDAIESELLYPSELKDSLVSLGLQAVELEEQEFLSIFLRKTQIFRGPVTNILPITTFNSSG